MRSGPGASLVLVYTGSRKVASGSHCKTLETTVETSTWQPLALVTFRGNHWPGSHQLRVGGCEPEVRTSSANLAGTQLPMRTNRAYLTAYQGLGICWCLPIESGACQVFTQSSVRENTA